MARILVVEDEPDVKNLMRIHLERSGHKVVALDRGEDAIADVGLSHYNLAVLDWMLPGMSGLDICKIINGQVPVLMVTARAESADIICGLEAGAEDYVTKPFDLQVFLARVQAILRRNQKRTTEMQSSRSIIEEYRLGDLIIDLKGSRVTKMGHELKLTLSEFKLLVALVKNEGRALSRDQLIRLVQGEGISVIDRAIDTHMVGLRKKMGPEAKLIETIRGIGYRICTT